MTKDKKCECKEPLPCHCYKGCNICMKCKGMIRGLNNKLFRKIYCSIMPHLPRPYWTVSTINMVDRFIKDYNIDTVFEWGSGRSTVWLSRRVGFVLSIEDNLKWVKNYKQVNIGLLHISDEALYVNSIIDYGPDGCIFDLAIIDGSYREKCFEYALERARYILFDDIEKYPHLKNNVIVEAEPNFMGKYAVIMRGKG